MHASGIGKALMAEMDKAELEQILSAAPLQRFTDFTITDPETLIEDLERTRKRGFAIDDQEKNYGMRCIAVPLHNWTGGAVAGISISGPVARIGDGEIGGLAEAVMQAGIDLATALGADHTLSNR